MRRPVAKQPALEGVQLALVPGLGVGRGSARAPVPCKEAVEEDAPLVVREALQVRLALGVIPPLQQIQGHGGASGAGAVEHVAHDVPHQPDEGQVDGVEEGAAQGDPCPFVAGVEVVEAVKPPAGEERLAARGGVAPLEGRIEERREREIGICAQTGQREAADGVGGMGGKRRQQGRRRPGVAGVELGHELQVVDEGAQLGGGAEVELHLLDGVEGLGEGVDVHADAVRPRAALQDQNGVGDVPGIALLEQARGEQARRRGALGLPEPRQQAPDLLFEIGVEGRRRGEIQALEGVEISGPQELDEIGAQDVGGGPATGRGQVAPAEPLEPKGHRPGRGPQARPEHAGALQASQGAVGGGAQALAIGDQVVGGALHGHEQAHGLLEGSPAALGGCGVVGPSRLGVGLREQCPYLVEVAAVPGPEPVAQAEDLAEAGAGGQGHGVQVVEGDAAPRRPGVRAIAIRAQAGGGDLPELLRGGVGDPRRRVAILLDLGGEGASAGPRTRHAQTEPGAGDDRPGEAVPFHGRVAAGGSRGEKLAVLEEEQGFEDRPGDVVEAAEAARGIAGFEDDVSADILDAQPGRRLLVVGRREPPASQPPQGGGGLCSPSDGEAPGAEAFDGGRQRGVAKAMVVGPQALGGEKGDGLRGGARWRREARGVRARRRFASARGVAGGDGRGVDHLVAQHCGQPGDDRCLEVGGAELEPDGRARQDAEECPRRSPRPRATARGEAEPWRPIRR